ncbi:MAG: Hsp33 family molecular chaperone HslO [Thermodesulfobacteriaceae bacterium]|nr:Hsp33 family molecular chaperone HslO [Thermodesulfobacteriaceae bacterium]MCX8041376.1 Hsp33 family molecular chaperone HslO [Thermodesulfobacteriaceae bacterium]MDW8136815.1 Hsp33 family molecular chaperone HslO [Thermodesulfobacterium sp.]
MGYLIKAVSSSKNFRAFAVECKEVVETVRKLQGLSPVASAALGRALAGVALLSGDLKIGKVLLQINGGGPLGEILAEGNWEGYLRGTVRNPEVYLKPENKKLPVGKAVGKKGYISVVKDLGLKEVYQSSTQLVSGEIAEDLAYYLTVSEQIPSAVSLGVLVDTDGSILAAGGFLIQKLPEASEEEVQNLEEKIKKLPYITQLLSQGYTPEKILAEIFEDIRILEKRPLTYQCACNLERVKGMLIALGKKELEDILKEGKSLEVICNFCREIYLIDIKTIEDLLNFIKKR